MSAPVSPLLSCSTRIHAGLAGYRTSGGAIACALALVASLLAARPASAEVLVKTSATADYQYNSNVYDLQAGQPVAGTSDYRHADRFLSYAGLFNADFVYGDQSLTANLAGTKYYYDHFTDLDHTEYVLGGVWGWKSGADLQGNLMVSRDRTMVAFTNLEQSELAIQTEQRESGEIDYQFTPEWRIEASGYTRSVDEPLENAANLQLRENEGLLALKFTGRAYLTSGVSAMYLDGNFSGTTAAVATEPSPSYKQVTGNFFANYKATGLSSLSGQLGYSRRTSSDGVDNVSGVTGSMDFSSQLTGKTSVDLTVARAIQAYITNTGSEIDTDGTFSVKWQATYKVGVTAGYTFTLRDLPKQGYIVGTDRTDHLQYVSLNIDYEALRWLALKPYINYQTRNSNFIYSNFNATVYGVNFTLQWQRPWGGA